MNFELKPIGGGTMTAQEFSERHGLKMVVCERPREYWNYREQNRYYARFDGCEMKDGAMLVGNIGDGSTPEEAVKAYLDEIRGRTIVKRAYHEDRRDIAVPNEFNLVPEDV